MASSFDTEFSAVAAPELLTEFGETVTHRPLGDSSNDDDVTAIVSFDEPMVEQEQGRATIQRGALSVSTDTTVSDRDRWKIRGRWYETETVEPPDGGLNRIRFVDRKTDTRTSGGRTSRR